MGLFGSIDKFIGSATGGLLAGLGTSAMQTAESARNRSWQEKMSNTAYQRAVEDLKKAGLNPLLALTNPASTPSGSTANIGGLAQSSASGAAAGLSTAQKKAVKAQESMHISSAKKADAEARSAEVNAEIQEKMLKYLEKDDGYFQEILSAMAGKLGGLPFGSGIFNQWKEVGKRDTKRQLKSEFFGKLFEYLVKNPSPAVSGAKMLNELKELLRQAKKSQGQWEKVRGPEKEKIPGIWEYKFSP